MIVPLIGVALGIGIALILDYQIPLVYVKYTAIAILAALDARTRSFGVQVVDVRIGRAMLSDADRALAYQQMQERHDREADAIADESGRKAGEIVAQAQAEAAAIMQASAGRDPEFYEFFKALRNYETLYGDPRRKNAATIVIPPDSAYLKHFNGH